MRVQSREPESGNLSLNVGVGVIRGLDGEELGSFAFCPHCGILKLSRERGAGCEAQEQEDRQRGSPLIDANSEMPSAWLDSYRSVWIRVPSVARMVSMGRSTAMTKKRSS